MGLIRWGFLILSTSDLLSLGGSQKITRCATGRTKHHSFAASPHHHILILANEKAVGSAARERQDNSRTNNQHYMLPLPLCSGKIFEGAHESSSGGQYQEDLHGESATYWPSRPCPGLGRQREGIYIYDSEKNQYLLSLATKIVHRLMICLGNHADTGLSIRNP